MALTVSATSNFVEGADRVRRYQVTGDSSYVTGGYDLFAALTLLATPASTQPLAAIKRINSVRHRTLASAQVGDIVVVDTYNTGIISALKLVILQRGATAELTAGTSTANLNVELVYEGY